METRGLEKVLHVKGIKNGLGTSFKLLNRSIFFFPLSACPSLVPKPYIFVVCNTKFVQKVVNFLLQATNVQGQGTML